MYIQICLAILTLHTIFAYEDHRPGPCPSTSEIDTIKNFNQTRFQGGWYVIQSYEEDDLECTKLNFTWYEQHRSFRSLFAEIKLPTAISSVQPIIEREANSNNGIYEDFSGYDYFFVDTDYDNYVVIWNCRNTLEGDVENLMIAGRDRHFNIDSSALLNATLAKSPFDRSRLKNVNQDNPVCTEWKGTQ